MEKIVRTHEKILDHLLRLRKTNSGLYFVPRKINNKGRLDKGYWFLGNEYYLNLSFWNGEDWKEKIHNIGFVVLKDKTSYIELSAQDSPDKAKFLSKVTKELGGFIKDGSKNKWYKHYSGTNFIECLDDFIKNSKPAIDKLITIEKPAGIKLLDKAFFNDYGKRIIDSREKQIVFGKKNKLSKICWNTENWKFPSGSQGKSVSIESYEADAGFGHEEWLLDKSKLVDGYHYAFLQPLNIKADKHENEFYNVSLFTINNLNKQYYVGEIKNVECINADESIRVFKIYKAKGWIEKMKGDVERAGANLKKFIDTPPEIFFNIRFKFKDVIQPDELIEIAENDINITTNRYKLLPQKSEIELGTTNDEDETEGNKKNTNKRKKVFNSDCEYDPYHDQMQNAIFELLKTSQYDYKKVFIEKGRVDIKAKTQKDRWHYFELKTDNPKQSIRKALGQILEYAYFPDTEKAEKLIIIADEKPNQDVIKYLDHIRNKFNLPVSYRHFNLDTNELSDDF
ncbi:MAG: hypothetical protein ACOYXB_16470 [Bacteroidota bacterium]